MIQQFIYMARGKERLLRRLKIIILVTNIFRSQPVKYNNSWFAYCQHEPLLSLVNLPLLFFLNTSDYHSLPGISSSKT